MDVIAINCACIPTSFVQDCIQTVKKIGTGITKMAITWERIGRIT